MELSPATAALDLEGFTEGTFQAEDDVSIYYRVYGEAGPMKAPLLCLGGLTRNSKDFHPIARELSQYRRVICMDFRGRGRSGYDPNWRNYNVETYVNDILDLLYSIDVHRVIVLGTSLGGVCAMALGATAPTMLAGVVLNDVGPNISQAAQARIMGYVGVDVRMADYDAAAAALKAQFASHYPGIDENHWRFMAECTFVPDPVAGDLRLDYDLKIADALREQMKEPAVDLWPLFQSLAAIPTMVVRGELSDVLDQETFQRMAKEKPGVHQLLIPNRGHVPLPHEEPFAAELEDFMQPL